MIRRFLNKKNICLAAVPLAMTCVSVPAHVAFADSQQIILEVSHAIPYKTGNSPIVRVAIANPAIADVAVIDKYNVNIIGKEAGSTTLMIWTANGMRQDFTVTVSGLDRGSAEAIKASMNLPDVEVELVGTGEKRKILLTGFVENQIEMELAENVAALYVDGEWEEKESFKPSTSATAVKFTKRHHKNIINNIQIRNPVQINLAAMVLDISDSDARKLGIEYGNMGSGSKLSKTDTSYERDYNLGDSGIFHGGMNFHDVTGKLMDNIDGRIQLMTTTGKGKVLSRPNITTMSGDEAQIMIGGEIPVPTSKDGEISVSWREYGIMMHIKPTVDSEGKIATEFTAEISSLDPANSVSTSAGYIPALTSRKVGTTVTMLDGQTMAIGGLVNNIDSKTIKKIPVLGDIPILGEFFKHTSTSKDKRELVILLTPTIVNNKDAGKVKTGDKIRELLEESKRDWEKRKEYDFNAPPTPDGRDKVKK